MSSLQTVVCTFEQSYMTNIIFDTNAARDFVEGIGLEELEQYAEHTVERFDERELRLFVSPIVIQELLYHLVDQSDRDFSDFMT